MAVEANRPKMMRGINNNIGDHQESIKGWNQIHCLSDELLMEILRRLPNIKYVYQCKCVCKCWAALASHPWFIRQFISLRFIGDGSVPDKFVASIMWYNKPDDNTLRRFPNLLHGTDQSLFRPSIFHSRDSSFSPFHSLGDVKTSLVASCNDLLLYYTCEDNNSRYNYYVSNVQTKDWTVLPSPPFYYGTSSFVLGFICDPFYSYESEREIVVLNDAYRYSVVVVNNISRLSSAKFRAHLFSSNTNQWCDRVLSLPKKWKLRHGRHPGIFFEGKLLFTCYQGMFGFDHNSLEIDNEVQCHLVKWPVGMLLGCHHVGVSQGHLQVTDFDEHNNALSVWVLQDYKSGNWMLKHKVDIRELMSYDSGVTEILTRYPDLSSKWKLLPTVLAFHPSRSDVIYLLVPGRIFLCNLSTKIVEFACRIPVAIAKNQFLNNISCFPVLLPFWPTPPPPSLDRPQESSRQT